MTSIVITCPRPISDEQRKELLRKLQIGDVDAMSPKKMDTKKKKIVIEQRKGNGEVVYKITFPFTLSLDEEEDREIHFQLGKKIRDFFLSDNIIRYKWE